MSDNTRLDQLIQEMSQLTETIKGRAGDATINKDYVEEQFKGLHKQISDIQAKANEPVRRVPGQDVPAVAPESVKATNRYKPMLKELQHNGKLNWGGTEVKPIDLFFAKRILDAQTKSAPSFAGGIGKGSSDDLNEVLKALSSTRGRLVMSLCLLAWLVKCGRTSIWPLVSCLA
ncbi:MAG: hypothetical protein IPL28_23825 [Chloroflexi bacterium]|nr:hypothetical protein [Chloroflexota bacterium]